MAITGTWKSRQSIEAGARKWGTGVNQIHSVNNETGRNIAPGNTTELISEDVTAQYSQDDGWQDIWHDGESPHDTGMDQRANWGADSPQLVRSDARTWPEWGNYANGVPGGTAVRSEVHGVQDAATPNQVPTETVSEGWENKVHGSVDNSEVSDTSQLFMQTSMIQRDKVREGSQNSGTASTQSAPIKSRIPGKRIKVWSDSQRRRYDMTPRTQNDRIRPWWGRTAGTGNADHLVANELNPPAPVTREVPSDPYTGPTPIASYTDTYGYQQEDMIPYA